jgi:hypothetical protein
MVRGELERFKYVMRHQPFVLFSSFNRSLERFHRILPGALRANPTNGRGATDVNSSAVLSPAAGAICLVDDDPSMLRALDRLLPSVGLQAQLFSEPLRFLSYVICNSVALAVIDI